MNWDDGSILRFIDSDSKFSSESNDRDSSFIVHD